MTGLKPANSFKSTRTPKSIQKAITPTTPNPAIFDKYLFISSHQHPVKMLINQPYKPQNEKRGRYSRNEYRRISPKSYRAKSFSTSTELHRKAPQADNTKQASTGNVKLRIIA